MKFYLDENLAPQIAARLRTKGVDAVNPLEAGNAQLPDRDQLRYAARAGRCLVTRNVRHFVVLARDAIRRQEPHAGIVSTSFISDRPGPSDLPGASRLPPPSHLPPVSAPGSPLLAL